MIDFRYHLISIVAVLVALSIGIVAGSGLGGVVVEDLESRVGNVADRNAELRAAIDELETRLDHNEDFARAVQGWLTTDRLLGRQLVVFDIDGTDQDLTDGLRAAAEEAGGAIVTNITLAEKLSLDSDASLDQLALAIRSVEEDPDQLRAEVAGQLGGRAAAVAAEPPTRDSAAFRRLEDLLVKLEEAGFLTVSGEADVPAVPGGALFVVAVGSEDAPPFPADSFSVVLAETLASQGAPVMVGEPSRSEWEVVSQVRAETASTVATADHADTTVGRIAVVMGLDYAAKGLVGHYGVDGGATEIIPAPTPGD